MTDDNTNDAPLVQGDTTTADTRTEEALAQTNIQSEEKPQIGDNETPVIEGETLAQAATRLGMSITVLRDLNREHIGDDGSTINSDRLTVR